MHLISYGKLFLLPTYRPDCAPKTVSSVVASLLGSNTYDDAASYKLMLRAMDVQLEALLTLYDGPC